MDLYTITWRLILPESPCPPLVLQVLKVAGMRVESSCHGMFETCFLEVYVMIQLASQVVLSLEWK
jgi:hypothetical protein